METRQFRFLEHAELRADKDRVIRGYAAVFHELSHDLGGFRERVTPGAFASSLDGDVRALVDHNPTKLLARTRSGTLRLNEDAHGLRAEISLPNTTLGHDTYESVRRGDLSQMSFAFKTVRDGWTSQNGERIRELREAKLFDISLVTYPAYEGTSAEARSIIDFLPGGAEIGVYAGVDRELVSESERERLRLRLELLQRL